MKTLIDLKNVTYTYDEMKVPALSDINLRILAHTWVAVVGVNGSGKSTLARLLNGLLTADSGDIIIDGMALTADSVWDIRKKVGIIFQNPDHQFVGATVEDDVAFGLENLGIPRDQMVELVNWALEQVNMLEFAHKAPQTLSGGQKQRVAIAGVIATRPQIIIMDESTSMLDPQGRQDIMKIMQYLQSELGITILSITHDMTEVIHADQVVVLKEGQIIQSGSVEQIFANPKELAKLGLNPPFTQQVQLELIKQGIDIDSKYLSEQEMVDELWQLYSKM
ncbi:energy-coupling factor transporter ATPase [Bombilactobacillus thymidiniphilus]|uniref:Energy-coupling factor transporter ATPase n=1 Tax=Bombilactobacillus thymidiniphilus TaxID=2923363 RepID=A0ABY4PDW6_9LACO|nr:energy-coupling factor transporter ATPase [Bombilactobacillus thymidiniphilus]UQS83973.1 energy-coupling factor transporter ATPase [Bombilactobacillus thymidiniphilus]